MKPRKIKLNYDPAFKLLLMVLGILFLVSLMSVLISAQQDGSKKYCFIMTIDDELNENTDKIVKILNKYGVPATFFLSGNLSHCTNKIRFLLSEGFTIGAHTKSHNTNCLNRPYYDALADIKYTVNFMRSKFHYRVKYFRVPYGILSNTYYLAIQKLGLQIVPWTVTFNEWSYPPTSGVPLESIKARLSKIIDYEPQILVLHNKPQTVACLESIIKEVYNYGQFVGIDSFYARSGK